MFRTDDRKKHLYMVVFHHTRGRLCLGLVGFTKECAFIIRYLFRMRCAMHLFLFNFLIFILVPSTSFSGYYEWRDDNGNVHYTDDMSKIPKQRRDKSQYIVTLPGSEDLNRIINKHQGNLAILGFQRHLFDLAVRIHDNIEFLSRLVDNAALSYEYAYHGRYSHKIYKTIVRKSEEFYALQRERKIIEIEAQKIDNVYLKNLLNMSLELYRTVEISKYDNDMEVLKDKFYFAKKTNYDHAQNEFMNYLKQELESFNERQDFKRRSE